MEADSFSVLPLDQRYFNTSDGRGEKKGEVLEVWCLANQTYLHVPAKLVLLVPCAVAVT